MAWQTLDSGLQLDAPRVAVAVLQSEAEMLHSPARDVSTYLRAHPRRWRVETFTERMFDGVEKIASSFDCVVIGFNALCHDSGIRRTLLAAGELPPNLLILHQRDPDVLAFLRGEWAAQIRPLSKRAEKAYPRERRETEEIVLNWPRAVAERAPTDPVDCRSSTWLATDPRSGWRTVLEVEQGPERVPVMLRSSMTSDRRLVVCTAWLDPRDYESHARLLTNAIEFCSHGRPEIAVVSPCAESDLPDGAVSPASLLARKLRLQGASTVQLAPPPGGELYFDQWPLREVSHVILRDGATPGDYLGRPDVKAWMESGGSLVGVDGGGRFSLHTGIADAHWVAQRWALWFHTVPATSWLDNLFEARAVLRVLARLQSPASRAHPERLGLDQPLTEYREEVAKLLERELGGASHVDGLVTPTAAVLDLDALVGGDTLSETRLANVRAWMRQAFDYAALEERFDIARALGPDAVHLFEQAAHDASDRAVSVVCVTRMREAAVSCGAPSVAIQEAGVEVDSLTELDTRLQLCAEFLAGVAELARTRQDESIGALDSRLVDRAVGTLSKQGVLVRLDGSLEGIGAETVSAEAIGLMSYFDITGEGTLPARPETIGIPAGAVEPMLKETRRARAAELAARAEEDRLRRPLGVAQMALLWVTIALAVGAAAAFAELIAVDQDALTVFGAAVALFTAVFVIVALLLVRWQLYPAAGRSIAATVSGGIPGLRKRLAALVEDDQRPAVREEQRPAVREEQRPAVREEQRPAT
jgi:hypothetical protein